LDLLIQQRRSTGELAEKFSDLSRYAVMQHLGVLEEAGLVLVRREGRQRFNYLNPVPIERVYQRWMHPFAARVAREMLALERHLDNQSKE
jgi:DNA-binding transcriptional ArsR family regulator